MGKGRSTLGPNGTGRLVSAHLLASQGKRIKNLSRALFEEKGTE